MAPDNALRIQGATASYRTHIALHAISLTLPRGSFCTVIGPNGAGKTTLLTLVNGLGTLTSGGVWVEGIALNRRTLRAIRLQCGYMPQHSTPDARLPISVGECIAMGRYGRRGLFRRLDKNDRMQIARIAELTGLEGLLSRPIGQVSGGERQKAALARALVQQPSIVLLDEPTANLDPRARVELMRIVEQYHHSSGCTVLMVTHALDQVPACSDYGVLIKQGHIVAAGALDAVCTAPALSALYDFPMMVQRRGTQLSAQPDTGEGEGRCLSC
jgi:ABC-type cobalamin/Fe3+-siderophores transport system ATPase subunit